MPVPGWYPDPQGPPAERWWDGTAWTAHTRVPAPPPVAADQARQWAAIAHLSALVGLVSGLSFLGPLIVYVVKRDEHPFVRDQAAEALNFNISFTIFIVALVLATFVLFFLLVGILLIPVIILAALAWLVLVVVGALAASRGEAYRYPLTFRFMR